MIALGGHDALGFGDEVRLGLDDPADASTADTLHGDLQRTVGQKYIPNDPADDPDFGQVFGMDPIGVGRHAAGQHELLLGLEEVLDQPEIASPCDLEIDRRVREKDRGLQGQYCVSAPSLHR